MNVDAYDNPIVRFKRPKNWTNVDMRDLLALNADNILQYRELCKMLDKEDEFLKTIVVLLYILSQCVKKRFITDF